MLATVRQVDHNQRRLPSAGTIASHGVLIAASFVAIAPFVWSTFGSFKRFRELVESAEMLPRVWTLDNYVEILTRQHFVGAFINSALIATTVTISSLVTSAALGFVFAKYRFRGREPLFTLLISTLMVPFVVLLVPLYVTVTKIGLVNNIGGVVVISLWTSFGIFMMRQFMEAVPSELLDAARIDGASEWRVFAQIAAPLVAAPLGALGVFVFLDSWDSFLWPQTVLSSPANQTLPLVLAGLKSLYWTRYDLWSAGSMLTVIPVMILYAFASRHFIRGIALGGIKG